MAEGKGERFFEGVSRGRVGFRLRDMFNSIEVEGGKYSDGVLGNIRCRCTGALMMKELWGKNWISRLKPIY
jgi:hypothetical protein